jgi:DNA-binding HxlR family transcriptional regulator
MRMATAETKQTPSWRRYRDACGAAQGLDIVGERWTLLVVRELLLGPKRFTDLREGLPGISTNILADRLETLEMSGVARRRTLPPPAGSKVYELTDWGRELETGRRRHRALGGTLPVEERGGRDRRGRAHGLVQDHVRSRGRRGPRCQLRGGAREQGFGLEVENGSIRVYRGAPADPDARIERT